MKKIFILLSAAMAVFSAFARVELGGITAQKYPDADSVTVEEIERVKYNVDGTSESLSEAWIKILTEKGRREESTLTVNYSKRYGEAKILYVGAVGLDGKEREIDTSSTTKESTDNSSMGMNIYDPLDRMITCTIPGLKVGETLHVKLSRRTLKSRVKNHWSDICIFEWKSPILKSVYEVISPQQLPIRTKVLRHPLGNVSMSEKKLDDGSTLHVFCATNSPQMFPEPDMPVAYTQVQCVRLSTAKSWSEISKWYWDLCLPHLQKTNYAMEQKVKELKGGLSGEALIRAIFKFVSQEIRYMGLTLEDTSPGYAPHDVDITFDSRYGVCRDKAALLVAMLRLAGVEAFPVLINVGAKMDKDVPQAYFNHAIVAAQLNPKKRDYMLMDPTNENTKDIFPAYLSDKSYLVCRSDGEELMTTPVPPSSDNALKIDSSGKLSKDGSLVVESDISFSGINDTAYRGAFVRLTSEERQRSLGRVLERAAPGAELISAKFEPQDMRDTEKPLKIKAVVRLPEAVLKGKSRNELCVPFFTKVFGLANWLLEGSTSLESRRYPLVLDTTAEVEEKVLIDLGEALGEVESLPPDEKTSGGYDYSRTYRVKDGVLEAKRRLAVSAVEFSPEKYLALREEIKTVESCERKHPQFKVDELIDADFEILRDSSSTFIARANDSSMRSWVTTNEVIRRVLTYAGKKELSEVKFHYNPSWKNIDIVSASVSNVNGVVRNISTNEMNVMDAEWAASCPRYPAGKILVLNLPSVEIGSVISIKSVERVKASPLPFYAVYSFDSKIPLREKSVVVDDWSRRVSNPKRVPREPNQPDARLWRDVDIISKCDWKSVSKILEKGAEVPEIRQGAAELQSAGIEEIRDWMARNVKVCGPSLYDLPVDLQLTDPDTVLKERYATRLDYVRTLAALLKRAGFEAHIVFVAKDALRDERIKDFDINKYPNPGVFSLPLCRVVVCEGGFFGLFAEKKIMYIGIENEYTPLGATAYDGCTLFDPLSGKFDKVASSDPAFKAMERDESVWYVRENGSVDLDVYSYMFGSQVGAFRKRFSEMLPEHRSRFYQTLLGSISQSASSTSELQTDLTSYPSKMSFKCYLPDFANLDNGVMTITLPPFDCSLPSLSSNVRETPICLSSTSAKEQIFTLKFPKGYTQIEYMPENFEDETVEARHFAAKVENDCLTITVRRKIKDMPLRQVDKDYFSLLKTFRHKSLSRSSRTIVVRKLRKD